MLNRERIALSLLEMAGGTLSRTKFVKLMFLLRMQTDLWRISSYYDFVPYKFGPFSFALYRDIERLEAHGLVSSCEDGFALNPLRSDETKFQRGKLSRSALEEISRMWILYGRFNTDALVLSVYRRYPWYAINSERDERNRVDLPTRRMPSPAVYTTGYEGKSVDGFFDQLLKAGIKMIIDVRANPVSRKYGFAGSRMKEIAGKLSMEYRHFPSLGISGDSRRGLSDEASRERLFYSYETHTLARRCREVREVGELMRQSPSTLVCIERDVETCHRSRLARAVADDTGMATVHL